MGLEGDAHRNHKHHGGPDRAVCLFAVEAITNAQKHAFSERGGDKGVAVDINGATTTTWFAHYGGLSSWNGSTFTDQGGGNCTPWSYANRVIVDRLHRVWYVPVQIIPARPQGANAPAAASLGGAPENAPVRPRRILLVDDNRDVLFSLKLLLEMEGHTVFKALDANDLPDEMDLASSEYLQSFTFRLRGREKVFLDKIEKALNRARGERHNRPGTGPAEDGEPLPGVYTTGWIKRGPVGLIGHTKSDASETIGQLREDAEAGLLPAATERDPQSVTKLLDERGVDAIEWSGWQLLDAYERALGEVQGRERVKVVPREEMVDVSLGRRG